MKILAQESSWLDKMVKSAEEAAPAFVAEWLERADAALLSSSVVLPSLSMRAKLSHRGRTGGSTANHFTAPSTPTRWDAG